MKKTALAVLTFVSLYSLLHAQQKNTQQLGRAVIDVSGAKLRLGMTKAEVAEKLAGKEISRGTDDDLWFVAPPDKPGDSLQFTNGRLNFVDRYWTTYDNDIAEALFGAVNSLNQEGFSACTVTTDIKTDPGTTLHRVWIRCGGKSILLVRSSHEGDKSYNMVYEHLGAFR